MSEKPKLKPCPFCGCDGKKLFVYGGQIGCLGCDATGPTFGPDDAGEFHEGHRGLAIAAWNHREGEKT